MTRSLSFSFSSARPNAISLFRHKPRFTFTETSSCQWQHRFFLSTHIIDPADLGEKNYPFFCIWLTTRHNGYRHPPSVCKFHVSLLLIKKNCCIILSKNANTFVNHIFSYSHSVNKCIINPSMTALAYVYWKGCFDYVTDGELERNIFKYLEEKYNFFPDECWFWSFHVVVTYGYWVSAVFMLCQLCMTALLEEKTA